MSALAKGLQLLAEFGRTPDPLSVSDICERLGLQKSYASKVLATLRDEGWIEQDPSTRRYSVALKAFGIGMHFIHRSDICRNALPVMRRLSEASGHSLALTIMSYDSLVHVISVEGREFADARFRCGVQLPYFASSAGVTILAHQREEVVDSLLERVPPRPLTSDTITDPVAYKRRLARAKQTGCAESRGESVPGLGGLSVPIFSEDLQVEAALGLIFPVQLVPPSMNEDVFAVLHRAARDISLNCGCSAYPYGRSPDTNNTQWEWYG